MCIVPGGVAEMLEFGRGAPRPHQQRAELEAEAETEPADDAPQQEVVFLRSRRGFVRFALQHGLQLVPVYGFGENRTFRRYSFGKRLRLLLSRKLGITIQPYRGRWGTLIPFAAPLHVVVGAPLPPVPACAQPSEADVDELLGRYIAALQALFEANKQLYGFGQAQLVVL